MCDVATQSLYQVRSTVTRQCHARNVPADRRRRATEQYTHLSDSASGLYLVSLETTAPDRPRGSPPAGQPGTPPAFSANPPSHTHFTMIAPVALIDGMAANTSIYVSHCTHLREQPALREHLRCAALAPPLQHAFRSRQGVATFIELEPSYLTHLCAMGGNGQPAGAIASWPETIHPLLMCSTPYGWCAQSCKMYSFLPISSSSGRRAKGHPGHGASGAEGRQ